MKYRTETPAEKLKLSEVLEKLWTHLTVDFITKLPLVVKNDAILVVCDRLSKMMYFVTITKITLVEGLVRLFKDNMWKLHRLLESVVSNRGLQFIAKMMKKLNKILGIETKLSTLFHLQTDSQIVSVTKFIQLVSPQPVDRFSQTKLRWKAPNEGYPHMCGMYKSNNK